jgi:hypothetical protein
VDKVVADAAVMAEAKQTRADEAATKKAAAEEAAASRAADDEVAAEEAAMAKELSGQTGQGESHEAAKEPVGEALAGAGM